MPDGFYIKRDDTFVGKKLRHGETGANKFLRLAKKDAGSWSRPVHETWDVDGKQPELASILTHESTASISEFVDKINRYSSHNATYLFEHRVKVSWWEIIVYPMAKFVKNYIWLQGFRDGTHGFVHAMIMSMHSFLTRAQLYLLWQKHPK